MTAYDKRKKNELASVMRWTLIASVVATSLCSLSAVNAQPAMVTVDKIAYCRAEWPICNDLLKPDFHWWEDHGVPDQIQKNTYIGKYTEPARENTRNLVFISSGQRFGGSFENPIDGEPIGGGDNNLLTGQPEWVPYPVTKSHHPFAVNPNSIAHEIFERGLFNAGDTFSALAWDARFNWGFTAKNCEDIVSAYYDWLKSKVDPRKLQTVYLAGHSRGGVLVLRLAQKFKQEFPHVIVVVHAFDPVPRIMDEPELGTATGLYIDNPVANRPRSQGADAEWSWPINFHEVFAHKKNLFVHNFVNGGAITDLIPEIRSVSHSTAIAQWTDLGWYSQSWHSYTDPGDGHTDIASEFSEVDTALAHLAERLRVLRSNIAPLATASASSTYCSAAGGPECYVASRVNDTDLDSRTGGQYSWTNQDTVAMPQWIRLDWPQLIRTDSVELITSDGYPLRDFEVQYLDGTLWQTAVRVDGNTDVHRPLRFAPVQTRAIRVLAKRGPSRQPSYVRLNELLVLGSWVTPPNVPPVARCSATPDYGVASFYSTLSSAGSLDPDGRIVSYDWTVFDGVSTWRYSGPTVTRSFAGTSNTKLDYAVTLRITDDRGAQSTAQCLIRVLCYTHPNCPGG